MDSRKQLSTSPAPPVRPPIPQPRAARPPLRNPVDRPAPLRPPARPPQSRSPSPNPNQGPPKRSFLPPASRPPPINKAPPRAPPVTTFRDKTSNQHRKPAGKTRSFSNVLRFWSDR